MSRSCVLQIPSSCPFFLGAPFFTWLEAYLLWDQNTDSFIMRQGSWWCASGCLGSPCWDEYLFYNKTLEVCNCPVTWHGEIVASALCGWSWPCAASLPRDKHRFTSPHCSPKLSFAKTGCFSKHQQYCESFRSLGTAVAHYLISSILDLLFECEGTNAWHIHSFVL